MSELAYSHPGKEKKKMKVFYRDNFCTEDERREMTHCVNEGESGTSIRDRLNPIPKGLFEIILGNSSRALTRQDSREQFAGAHKPSQTAMIMFMFIMIR